MFEGWSAAPGFSGSVLVSNPLRVKIRLSALITAAPSNRMDDGP
jgi:hypothetical protein